MAKNANLGFQLLVDFSLASAIIGWEKWMKSGATNVNDTEHCF